MFEAKPDFYKGVEWGTGGFQTKKTFLGRYGYFMEQLILNINSGPGLKQTMRITFMKGKMKFSIFKPCSSSIC